jgi:hypothetical protein
MAGGRTPPAAHLAAKYTLTVDGVETAVFSELVELSSGLDPSDLAPGLDQKGKATRKRLHAERTPGTVILRRGQTNDLRLFEWHTNPRAAQPPGGTPFSSRSRRRARR